MKTILFDKDPQPIGINSMPYMISDAATEIVSHLPQGEITPLLLSKLIEPVAETMGILWAEDLIDNAIERQHLEPAQTFDAWVALAKDGDSIARERVVNVAYYANEITMQGRTEQQDVITGKYIAARRLVELVKLGHTELVSDVREVALMLESTRRTQLLGELYSANPTAPAAMDLFLQARSVLKMHNQEQANADQLESDADAFVTKIAEEAVSNSRHFPPSQLNRLIKTVDQPFNRAKLQAQLFKVTNDPDDLKAVKDYLRQTKDSNERMTLQRILAEANYKPAIRAIQWHEPALGGLRGFIASYLTTYRQQSPSVKDSLENLAAISRHPSDRAAQKVHELVGTHHIAPHLYLPYLGKVGLLGDQVQMAENLAKRGERNPVVLRLAAQGDHWRQVFDYMLSKNRLLEAADLVGDLAKRYKRAKVAEASGWH